MATWTLADTAARALEAIGAVGAGQSASPEDTARAEEIVQSVYEQLVVKELAPFPISAVPEWAQPMVRDLVALPMGPPFGIHGQAYLELKMLAKDAEMDLVEQCSGYVHPVPAKGIYF